MSDKPDVYYEGDKVIYRASSLGSCIRGLVAARLGIRPANVIKLQHQQYFDEGHLHEGAVIEKLVKQGMNIDDGSGQPDGQHTIELNIRDNIYIRGHVDGIGNGYIESLDTTLSDLHVIEVKSMSKDVYDKWIRAGFNEFYRYAIQLSIYMSALQMGGVFVAKNRNSGAMDVTVLSHPPLPLAEISERINKVEDWVELDSFPFCDFTSFPCKWFHIHDETNENEDWFEVDEAKDPVLDALCTEYEKADLLERQGKARKQIAREKLENLVGSGGRWKKLGWDVKVANQSSRRMNQSAAKEILDAQGVDPDSYHSTSTYNKVTVSRTGQADTGPAATGD